jgi:hypothetical protein
MRFRRYLGRQYQDGEYTRDAKNLQARPIYCIFLLNHSIGFPQHPMVEVNTDVRDAATGEVLNSEKNAALAKLETLKHQKRQKI